MAKNFALEQNKTEQEIVNLAFEMATIDRHSDFNRSVLAAASIRWNLMFAVMWSVWHDLEQSGMGLKRPRGIGYIHYKTYYFWNRCQLCTSLNRAYLWTRHVAVGLQLWEPSLSSFDIGFGTDLSPGTVLQKFTKAQRLYICLPHLSEVCWDGLLLPLLGPQSKVLWHLRVTGRGWWNSWTRFIH